MSPGIERRTRGVFIFVALIPMLLAATAYWTTSRYIARVASVAHAQEVLNAVDDLLLTVVNAETGQRGYLLTGRGNYLPPFLDAANSIGSKLETARKLTADNPRQRQNLSNLKSAVLAKMGELRRTIELRRERGLTAAMAVIETDRGHDLMGQIREAIGEMRREEKRLLDERTAEQKLRERESLLSFSLGILLTIGLLFWASHQIQQHDRERQKAESSVRQANAELEKRVERRTRELRRSNEELENFAYVASHDLQEPLRMVASYTSLIAQRYRGKLDADADEFISYAVDGAKRMQQLINDLLQYSRLGVHQAPRIAIDFEDVLQSALTNLGKSIEESGAAISHDPLPKIQADRTQFVQVLQNLIGNGLKFRGPAAPRIHVSSDSRDGEFVISVRDNGIGIDPKHSERVFGMFQRLHPRDRYAGTGIGLAVCKKTVERHGGRIWFESAQGEGAVFFFTLPR